MHTRAHSLTHTRTDGTYTEGFSHQIQKQLMIVLLFFAVVVVVIVVAVSVLLRAAVCA